MNRIAIFLFFTSLAHRVDAVSLTDHDWSARANGKVVFLKFATAWCQHASTVSRQWNQLMEEYAGNRNKVLVAYVDCQDGAKVFCSELNVTAYPSFRYGNIHRLQEYKGDTSYEALAAFAKDLKPVCGPGTPAPCEGDEKKQLETYITMDDDALGKAYDSFSLLLENEDTRQEEKLVGWQKEFEATKEKWYQNKDDASEKEMDSKLETIRALYKKAGEEREAAIQKINKDGLSILKAVLSLRRYLQRQKERPKDEL